MCLRVEGGAVLCCAASVFRASGAAFVLLGSFLLSSLRFVHHSR